METKNKKEICRNWNLYVITDLAMAAPRNYIQIIREVLMGGANVIQLRDKTTPFETLIDVGCKIKPMFEEYGATLIINDNPYLAKEIDADGVHLGQEDMPVDIAREILGPGKIIGLSTHTKAQAIHAMFLDVDYIGVGPIFPTTTKEYQHAPLGVSMIKWMSREIKLPFVPIGGINPENIKEVYMNGGTAPAVVSAVMRKNNLTEATRELINTINEARGKNP